MRISLNLASRPYADLRPAIKRLRLAMAALALLACGLGVGLHALHNKADQARSQEHRLDSQIAGVRAEQQGYQKLLQQPDNAQLLAQINRLNQLIDEKAFSWTLAMEDLETVLPGGVQVATLEPVRAKDGSTTLHLRVVGPRDHDLDLVRNLEHSRRFLLPRIVGESVDTGDGTGQQRLQPISASNRDDFDLLAEYNPPAPGEYKTGNDKQAVTTGLAHEDHSAAHHAHPRPANAGAAPPQTQRRPSSEARRPAVHIAKPNPDRGGAR